MSSLGPELKKDREAKGISLKAVADATRISLRYLEAVESDRLDLLPGGFFIKAILKAYAGAVGLGEEEVLERYRRAGVLTRRAPEPPRKALSGGGHSRKRNRSLAGAAALLIVVASFAAYFMTRPGKAPTTVAGPSAVLAERTDPVLPETAPAAAAPAPEAEKGLRIEISFIQETWIQIYADGRLALDGIRQAGDTAEVRAATELLIHLGNAGGLTYALNGRPGKLFGRPGAVVKNIRITGENLASYVQAGGNGDA